MKIIKYLKKTKEFFKDLFGYEDKISNKLDNEIIKYEEELINMYNNLMFGLKEMYFKFSGQRLQLQPISYMGRDYDDLFSDNVRKEFNIYQTSRGLMLRRKGLEELM